MNVIQYDQIGDPASVLTLQSRPDRPLAPGEARVAVLAAPIHPSNLLQIAGQYGEAADLPATPGSEGIGRVVEIAPDVPGLTVGQRVLLTTGGTWCDQLVGPAAAFVPLPDAGDPEQLAMTVVNPLTALLLLDTFVDLAAGDWVVQNVANSAVGTSLVQLARARGLKTVNVVRRAELASELEAIGADAVVVDGPDLSERIRAATGGAPIRLGIDAIGGTAFGALLAAVADGATVVTYGAMSGEAPSLDPMAVIFRDVSVRGFWLSRWFRTATEEARGAAFGEVITAIVTGQLHTRVDSRFGLDDIAAAVNRAAAGGRDGKVLLVPGYAAETQA